MDATRNQVGIITLAAWRREISIAIVGRGYNVGVRNIGMPQQLASVICTDLSIAASTDRATTDVSYTLTAMHADHRGALARFDITAEEAQRIADWLGLDMPRPLALQAAS